MPTTCPPALAEAMDLRSCDPGAEIDRCRRILARLEALPAADLLRPTPPEANDDLISVVVPMYNARRWIDSCLKGLLAQTHANQEIFCVDDCSSDDGYERLLEQFGGDRRICAVKLARRVGPYQIKNWVVGALARGRWIAFQDADDVSHPGRFSAQRRWMAEHGYRLCGTCTHQFFPPGIALPLGTGAPIEIDGVHHNLAFFPPVARTVELPTPEARAEQCGADFWQACRTGPYKVYRSVLAEHATIMVERSLVLEFGGFDGRTRVAADSEFSARVVRFHAIGNLPHVWYSRRVHADSLTQHPDTSLTSALRLAYRAQRAPRAAQLVAELAAGRVAAARALCTADFYCRDVEVREMRSGFAVTEQPRR